MEIIFVTTEFMMEKIKDIFLFLWKTKHSLAYQQFLGRNLIIKFFLSFKVFVETIALCTHSYSLLPNFVKE